jgi:hypothetical protein
MLRRGAELHRLALYCVAHCISIGSADVWAFAIAEVCLFRFGLDETDLYTFRQQAPHDISITEDEATAAIHRVCDLAERKGIAYRPTSAAALGKRFKLTKEVRRAEDIRTMSAIDETPAEEKARRQELDRNRKHKARSTADPQTLERIREHERELGRQRRAAQGARPHAESLSRKQPWLLEGKSRRTWERHRAAKTSTQTRAANSSFRLYLPSVRAGTDESLPRLPEGSGHVRNGHGKRRPRRDSRQQRGLPMMKEHGWHCGAIVQCGTSSVVSVSFGSNGGRQ